MGWLMMLLLLPLSFKNHFKKRPPTIELKTNFLYPTKPGKVIGYGQVVKSGKNIAFLEGRLEQNNRTVVTATSTCVIVDMPQVNLKKNDGRKKMINKQWILKKFPCRRYQRR